MRKWLEREDFAQKIMRLKTFDMFMRFTYQNRSSKLGKNNRSKYLT